MAENKAQETPVINLRRDKKPPTINLRRDTASVTHVIPITDPQSSLSAATNAINTAETSLNRLDPLNKKPETSADQIKTEIDEFKQARSRISKDIDRLIEFEKLSVHPDQDLIASYQAYDAADAKASAAKIAERQAILDNKDSATILTLHQAAIDAERDNQALFKNLDKFSKPSDSPQTQDQAKEQLAARKDGANETKNDGRTPAPNVSPVTLRGEYAMTGNTPSPVPLRGEYTARGSVNNAPDAAANTAHTGPKARPDSKPHHKSAISHHEHRHPNGDYISASGTKITHNPDGSEVRVSRDGMEVTTRTDGSQIIKSHGATTIIRADHRGPGAF